MTTSSNNNNDQQQQQQYILLSTFRQFKRALYDPRNDFQPFPWLYQLVRAMIYDICLFMGCSTRSIGSSIPYLAISLIGLVFMAYIGTIRKDTIQLRWCPRHQQQTSTSTTSTSATSSFSSCAYIYLHDCLVIYFCTMCLYHYIQTNRSSPGIHVRHSTTTNSSSACNTSTRRNRSTTSSCGGMYGFPIQLDITEEQSRVALYGPLQLMATTTTATSTTTSTTTTTTIPPEPTTVVEPTTATTTPKPYPGMDCSFCIYCQHIRPPRCHHCSICNQCILQYDHHCYWINNCIGYNNYRSFLLTIAYVSVGSWYGVGLLFYPFYDSIKDQIQQVGWTQYLYASKHGGTGLLDLPSIQYIFYWIRYQIAVWFQYTDTIALLKMKQQHHIDMSIVILHLTYGLLLILGTIVSIFFGQHVKYVCTARTTLEHQIFLQDSLAFYTGWFTQQQKEQPQKSSSISLKNKSMAYQNPFDQGSWWKNWQQIMGPSWIALLLPIPVNIPPPYSIIPLVHKKES